MDLLDLLCESHVPSPKRVWEGCRHWPSESITVAKFKTRLMLANTQIHDRMKGERTSMQEVRVSKVQSMNCTHKTDVTALAEPWGCGSKLLDRAPEVEL